MEKKDGAQNTREMILKLSKDPAELLEYYSECINKIHEEGIEQFLLKYVGREKGRQFLYIQLWTPEWNDGEECLHSYDYCQGSEIISYDYFKYEDEMFKGIEEKEIEDSSFLNFEERDIRAVIKTLEYKYETNKQCLIILGGNEKIVSITKDYSCGY